MLSFSKILAILLSLAIILPAHALGEEYNQAGYDMLERCRSKGAIVLVDELLQDNSQGWEDVAEQIATGNSQWIEASGCLAHGVYFSFHDRADYALAILMQSWSQALLKNPQALLERDGETSLAMICSLPLDYRDKSLEFADDFLKKSLASINKIEDDDLQNSKKACELYLTLDHERFVRQFTDYQKSHKE